MKVAHYVIGLIIGAVAVATFSVLAPVVVLSRLNQVEAVLRGATEIVNESYARSLALKEYMVLGTDDAKQRFLDSHGKLGGLIWLFEIKDNVEAVTALRREYQDDQILLTTIEDWPPQFASRNEADLASAMAKAGAVTQMTEEIIDWEWVELQEARLVMNVVGRIISVSITLLAAVLIVLAWRFNRRLVILNRHVERLAAGERSARVNLGGGDEFSEYASTLNLMADEVNKSLGNLEQLVEDRTAELSASSARLKGILDSIGEGLVVVDVDRRVVTINDVALSLMGYSDRNEILGKQWPEDVLPPGELKKKPLETYPLVRALEERRVQRAGLGDDVMLKGNRATAFPADVTSSPLIVGDSVVGGVLVLRDISEEARIDAAKTGFVSLASHQLRTPLSAINWYTEVLLSEIRANGKFPEWLEYANTISVSSKRMVSLVNHLLDVSRVESGRVKPEWAPVRLEELIDRSISQTIAAYAGREINVRRRNDGSPDEIFSDESILGVVIGHLLSNAVRYTEPSPMPTAVEIYRGTRDDGTVEIRVTDFGIGIPESGRHEIFTKLFRADNAKQVDTTGSGLGLYVVRSLLKLVGGEISFESKLGKGTTFSVVLAPHPSTEGKTEPNK